MLARGWRAVCTSALVCKQDKYIYRSELDWFGRRKHSPCDASQSSPFKQVQFKRTPEKCKPVLLTGIGKSYTSPFTVIKCKSLPAGVLLHAADGADEDYIQSNLNKSIWRVRRFNSFWENEDTQSQDGKVGQQHNLPLQSPLHVTTLSLNIV